jgi:HEAT repeat protein
VRYAPASLEICLAAVLAIMFTLHVATGYTQAQDPQPITKKNLLRALTRGSKHPSQLPLRRLINLVEQNGVDFQMTPADEREVRTQGTYLGAEGLNDLIAAVHNNYRQPSVPLGTASPIVANLIIKLGSSEPSSRSAAASALGEMGGEAMAASAALIQALQDKEESVKVRAADALGRIKPKSKGAVTGLIIALKDKNSSSLRAAAARALVEIRLSDKDAKDALKIALSDESDEVRAYSAIALIGFDEDSKREAVAVITTQIKKRTNSALRYLMLDALAGAGPATKDALPVLLDAVTDYAWLSWENSSYGVSMPGQERQELQKRAFKVLKGMGEAARHAMEERLTKRDSYKRSEFVVYWLDADPSSETVITILRGMGMSATEWSSYELKAIGDQMVMLGSVAVPALKEAVRDQKNIWAVRPLLKLDPSAKDLAFTFLKAALSSQNLSSKKMAMSVLVELGPSANSALPALINVVNDENMEIAEAAIKLLGKIGPEAKPSIPVLKQFIERGSGNVVFTAISTLAAIGGDDPAVVSFLVGLLEGYDLGAARTAANSLKFPLTKEALSALIRIFSDETREKDLRAWAFRAVGSMGADGASAAPALIKYINYSSGSNYADIPFPAQKALTDIGTAAVPSLVQSLAAGGPNSDRIIDTLAKIGPGAKDAIPALVSSLKHKNWKIRYAAATALGDIGPAASDAVAPLTIALGDKAIVREVAATALGKIGRGAQAAIPSLRRLLNDKDYAVKNAASHAISLIEAAAAK